MKVSVILPAAGLGTRMGREKSGTSRKQFMLLDGAPILLHTIRKFLHCSSVSEIVVALRQEDLDWARGLVHQDHPNKPVRFVEGGDSRQQSVENALAALTAETDLVAVHDAVRPFIDSELVEKVIAEAAKSGAAIVGIVPIDGNKLILIPGAMHSGTSAAVSDISIANALRQTSAALLNRGQTIPRLQEILSTGT